MAKMKAVMAAVLVMEKEGVSQAFGVPGAAINPLYAAMRERGTIAHVLARHVDQRLYAFLQGTVVGQALHQRAVDLHVIHGQAVQQCGGIAGSAEVLDGEFDAERR